MTTKTSTKEGAKTKKTKSRSAGVMSRAERAKISDARKETAYAKLTELAEASQAATAEANAQRQKLFAGVLKAYNAGLTYEDMAEILGVTAVRISQVLQDQRSKNGK